MRMRRAFHRLGLSSRGRWAAALLGGSAAAVVLLFAPWREGPAQLELVALTPDGSFASSVAIPASWADTLYAAPGIAARVPLILGVRNTGGEPARPQRVEISAPSRIHLTRPDGRPLQGYTVAGSPLIRYELSGGFPVIRPGRMPTLLPALDTLWLELVVPSFYCMTLSDSVPEFVPAPRPDPVAVSRVQIFYSFEGDELKGRQTGLLTVQLDPALIAAETPEPPPVFPVEMREPGLPLPAFEWLQYEGSRHGFCGEPEEPLELFTTVWTTPSGGRFFVLYYGGAPRKYLFDLDRDSIIELEMWDPDADGRFEARRAARLAIPPFLLPRREPVPQYNVLALAELEPDSLAQLDRFRGATTYEVKAPKQERTASGRFRPMAVGRDRDVDDKSPRYTVTWGRTYAAADAARVTAPSAPRITRGAPSGRETAQAAPPPRGRATEPGTPPLHAERERAAPDTDERVARDRTQDAERAEADADVAERPGAAQIPPGRRFREARKPIRLLGRPAEPDAGPP